MKSFSLNLLRILLFLLIPVSAASQMFSVGGEMQGRADPFAPYLRLGLQPVDFEFTGDPSSIIGNNPLAFAGTAAHFSFESGGFNLGFSLANKLTGVDERNYFDLAIDFTNPFYLIRRPQLGIGVPVKLSSKLTAVRNNNDAVSTEFSQTNLSAGAGAVAIAFIPNKFGFSAQFIPSLGFSSASGGLIGGNVFSLKGTARVNIYNLLFGKNLSLGYDYMYDSYNIDGEEHDYDFTGHSITIGISL